VHGRCFILPQYVYVYHNLLFRLIQDVTQKTNEVAGDGTTTATVLAHAIYAEGVKNVAAGCNPMDLRRGSQAAVEHVVEFLSENTKTITTTTEIAQACRPLLIIAEGVGGEALAACILNKLRSQFDIKVGSSSEVRLVRRRIVMMMP
jgi:chaperonin GroEL (HSP60 family)